MRNKKIRWLITVSLLVFIGGCTSNKTKEEISSNSTEEVKTEDKMDEIIKLVVSEKYDEALVLLEKIALKEPKNQEIKQLINGINHYKEGQKLFEDKKYKESKEKFENVINNESVIETLKDKSKLKIEEIEKLLAEQNIDDSKTIEVSDRYVNERNTLKKYAKNPEVIDTISDSVFKEQYDSRYNKGIMDFVEGDIVRTFAELYPDAEIDTSSFSDSYGNSEMTEDKALELVKQAYPELDGKVNWYVEKTVVEPKVFMVTGNSKVGKSTPPVFVVTMEGQIYKDFEYFSYND